MATLKNDSPANSHLVHISTKFTHFRFRHVYIYNLRKVDIILFNNFTAILKLQKNIYEIISAAIIVLCSDTLSRARWHSTDTNISSFGILGTKPDYTFLRDNRYSDIQT